LAGLIGDTFGEVQSGRSGTYYLVPDRKPSDRVGWAELAKPNIMILLTHFLNVGQRFAFAQPTKQVLGQTLPINFSSSGKEGDWLSIILYNSLKNHNLTELICTFHSL